MRNINYLIAKYCLSQKTYDEIICECDFHSKLKNVLNDALDEKLFYCRKWGKGHFFTNAYFICGGIIKSEYCTFDDYKKYYFDRLVNYYEVYHFALGVSGMVYALLSVLKERQDGISDLLDDLELFLKEHDILSYFKKLVDKTNKRYDLKFSLVTRHPRYWDLEDFGYFNCDFFGWEFGDGLYKLPIFFWKQKENRLYALKRIKLYFETLYFGKSIVNIKPDEEWDEIEILDYERFYEIYPQVESKIESEQDENSDKMVKPTKSSKESVPSDIKQTSPIRLKYGVEIAEIERIIFALCKMNYFEVIGKEVKSPDKDVFKAFGDFLGLNLSNYHNNIKLKDTSLRKHLDIFKKMEEVIIREWNNKNEQ